jgi:hypothetical protein
MAPKKENTTTIEETSVQVHIDTSGKSVDIQNIVDNGFDVRKDAEDVISIVAFMVQYDLELICKLLQGHLDGCTETIRCFKEIEGMIRRKNIDMDAIKIKLHRLAHNLEEKD